MLRSSIAFVGVAMTALVASSLPAAAATHKRARHARTHAATTRVTVLAGKPSEFGFKLSKKTVGPGKVVFKVENKGSLPHDFKICSSSKGGHANSCKGTVTKLIQPGQTRTLTYVFKKKGTYEYLCTVAGHAAAGMKGDLKVRAGDPPTRVTVLAGKPSELRFKLSKKTVKTGKVVFKVENKGALSHDFKICSSPKGGHANSCKGKGTKLISPHQTRTLTFVFKKKGTYEYLCTVAGHAAAGMKGDLKVR